VTQPPPAGTIVDGVDIDAVHAAVSSCPGVARVGSGSLAALTTYLPGRRIPGIRINPDTVELEVIAEWDSNASDISRSVQAVVADLVGTRRVDITIADIDLPGQPPQDTGEALPPPVEVAPAIPALPATPIHPLVVPPER
jgi:uncharacterized alkaline shock family protein YloU